MDYRIDAMHCDGCARGVRAAVAQADPAATLGIDVPARRVTIDSHHPQAVLQALSEAGFPPSPREDRLMRVTAPTLAALLLSLVGAAAVAQTAPADHSGHTMPQTGMEPAMQMPADASPATMASMEAMQKMHKAMMIDYSGNPDIDFARGMIPHHQGAIAMAKIELEYGKDPQMRALAEEIIKAQEAEIATLNDWIAANDKPVN